MLGALAALCLLGAASACTPVPDAESRMSGAQSGEGVGTVRLTATDREGRSMSGEAIREALLGGAGVAAAASAGPRAEASAGTTAGSPGGETRSGGSPSGEAQSGEAQSGGAPVAPRGIAVLDPKTWEVLSSDADPIVALEADAIRVEVPTGGAAIALVWPLSPTHGYSQVVIGDDGHPIEPGATVDLVDRMLAEGTADLGASVDAAATGSDAVEVSPAVRAGLTEARLAVAAASPSPSGSTPSGGATTGASPTGGSATAGAPTPATSTPATSTPATSTPAPTTSAPTGPPEADTVPAARSLAALDDTWRAWLAELGHDRAAATTGTDPAASPSAPPTASSSPTAPAPSPSATPSTSPSAPSRRATDPLETVWRGVTLEDATSPGIATPLDLAAEAAGRGQGWVRIVVAPGVDPSAYDAAVRGAHARGLLVMLTPLGTDAATACAPAAAPTHCSTDDHLSRLTTVLDHFTGPDGPTIDAWEVGEDPNAESVDTLHGTYEPGRADMATRVSTATTLVHSRTDAPVVLTLRWSLATALHPESSTFTWARANAVTSGAEAPDVVLLSIDPTTSPMGTGLGPALVELSRTFPSARVGIGELSQGVGPYAEVAGQTPDEGGPAARAALAGWYASASTSVPESLGGLFWTPFRAQATGPGGALLVSALEEAAR